MSWREDVVGDLEKNRKLETEKYTLQMVRHFADTIAKQQAEIDRLESALDTQKLIINTIVHDYDGLRNALNLRFDELDEIIEKLWFAPGGPVAASLIVQYDHHNK